MSSSISADYSPTSNYSYPTDVSLSPQSPIRNPRSYNNQATAQPPRLSSPHIFRDIFASEAVGPPFRSPPRLPPLQEINFAETMQDVNRALQSANRAIQTAQEAFQSRQTTSTNMNRGQDVVDLTHSPPSPSRANRTFDPFSTRTLHSHNSQVSNRMANSSLNEALWPRAAPSANSQSLFVEEDDPTSRYAGQSDSLAGARRRYEAHQSNVQRSYMTIPNMERTLMGSGLPAARRRDEEEAIRRQRVAREQWEQNQRRQQQRDRLQLQRDRILGQAEQRADRNRDQNQHTGPYSRAQAVESSSSETALHPGSSSQQPQSRDSSSSPSSTSVISVDLTGVNNKIDLAAALVQSQSSNPAANPTNKAENPRSALTAYKCPICLESPRNATTTICGHLFCHECILETLKNSENMRREEAPPHRKVKGQCPVCRKELARKEEEGKQRTLVPLAIQFISKTRLEELKRHEKKRQRKLEKANKGKGKGKGKEESDEDQIFDLSSDGEDGWGVSGSSQKENKTKRLKLSASEELDQELFGTYTYDDQD